MTDTSVLYPEGIAPALGHLNNHGNDIEVFVEDTVNRNVWRNVLKKFLPKGVTFSDPIALGGRKKVLEECSRDQIDDGRKKLYIIDADLDLLTGAPMPPLLHLHRLQGYCIENYLVQEEALVQVAQVMDVNVSEADARALLDFPGWKRANEEEFTTLFRCYAVANQLDERHRTVGHWIGHVCKDAPMDDCLCPHKTNARVMGLFRAVRLNNSKDALRQMYNEVSNNAETYDFCVYVSGKDGLLNRLIVRLKRFFGHMNDNQIKVLLSTYFEVDVDPNLKHRLEIICSS